MLENLDQVVDEAELFSEKIKELADAMELSEVAFVLALKVGAQACDTAFPEYAKAVNTFLKMHEMKGQ